MKIIADSCSDLTVDILRRFEIEMVPLSVVIANVVYRDFIDLDQEKLFALVRSTGELPKTTAATVAEFVRAFEGDSEVLCITISSRLSASYHNACLAADLMPAGQVKVIDSLNLSTGIGQLAVRAAELRARGLTRDVIAKDIEVIKSRLWSSFMLDSLEYVYKGGRCNAVQSILGSVLRIHPVLAVMPDGSLGIHDKPRGARQHGLDSLLKTFRENLPRIDLRRVFVTHSTCPDDAGYLAAEVERLAKPGEVLITQAGSVISSHCGPNTIGILYSFNA